MTTSTTRRSAAARRTTTRQPCPVCPTRESLRPQRLHADVAARLVERDALCVCARPTQH
jgi:hypothetical protein